MSEIRKKIIETNWRKGDTFRVSRTFTEKDTLNFSDITRDYNPVHLDQRFSDAKGLHGKVCHGLLVASMVTEIGGQGGLFASGMNFRFRRPVYFGDTIECCLTIIDVDDDGRARSEVVYRNQEGDTVLEASVEGIIPGIPEQKVMQGMVEEGDPTNKLR